MQISNISLFFHQHLREEASRITLAGRAPPLLSDSSHGSRGQARGLPRGCGGHTAAAIYITNYRVKNIRRAFCLLQAWMLGEEPSQPGFSGPQGEGRRIFSSRDLMIQATTALGGVLTNLRVHRLQETYDPGPGAVGAGFYV